MMYVQDEKANNRRLSTSNFFSLFYTLNRYKRKAFKKRMYMNSKKRRNHTKKMMNLNTKKKMTLKKRTALIKR